MSEISKEERDDFLKWHKIFKEELFEFGSQDLVNAYAQEMHIILDALAVIDDQFRDSLLTDESKFSHYDLEDSQLQLVSEKLSELGKGEIRLKHTDKIVDIAQKISPKI